MPGNGPLVFISHKHRDADIAGELARFLKERSASQIRIHLSSDSEFEGPRQGENLNDELKHALASAEVVLLVYTSATEDWSYCMWECGVATDPDDPTRTSVLVVQCGEEKPSPFASDLRVDARSVDSLTAFVKRILTSADMFARHDEPVTGFAPESADIAGFGEELHQRLAALLSDKSMASEEPVPASPFLRLAIPAAGTEALQQADTFEEASRIVQDAARVVAHVGIESLFQINIKSTTTLGKILQHWRQNNDGPARWFESLIEQVRAAADDRFSLVKWAPCRSEKGRVPIPIVAASQVHRADGARWFDTYFVAVMPRPVPVGERMLRREQMFHKNLEDTPAAEIGVADLVAEMGTRSRVPFLGKGGRPEYIVHRSEIDRYISARALAGEDISALTVKDLLDDDDRESLFRSFAVVDRTATIDTTMSVMEQDPRCQDVFVTDDGTTAGQVVGWLTNIMFLDV